MTPGLEPVLGGIFLHAMLGMMLLAAVIAAGDAGLRLAARLRPLPEVRPGERLAVAYGLGLAWLVFVATASLSAGIPEALPLFLALPVVIAMVAGAGSWLPWRRLAVAALLASPALVFAVRSGLEWHGPTVSVRPSPRIGQGDA
ncbi:hypothetical protein, partial [Caenispirillum salinarum]|uniref:hypothetical protein n=1 Tax=Caenispirillum salinarum TaxID=859058 RepID=UPI0005B99D69